MESDLNDFVYGTHDVNLLRIRVGVLQMWRVPSYDEDQKMTASLEIIFP